MESKFTSKDFSNDGFLPQEFTCDGENISPHLKWIIPKKQYLSATLILDDPDSSEGTWTHWIIYNIPASVSELPQNVSDEALKSLGITQGMNDFGNNNYQGPCPRKGTLHHYCFNLYFLDKILDLNNSISPTSFRKFMHKHIITSYQLIGCFQR